jgi:hypothetical protein
MTLTVAVFSYNRGAYLRHCLESARRNLPWAQIVVYDDASDDPETLAVLAELEGASPQIIVRRAGPPEQGRHGGLYANMQQSLDQCSTSMILFLQDDTQVVRPVAATEIAAWENWMNAAAKPFLGPCFFQGRRSRKIRRRITPAVGLAGYHLMNTSLKAPKPVSYRDVTLACAYQLRAAEWKFEGSEVQNATGARTAFGAMPFLLVPFVAFMPEVPTFRSRHRNLGAILAEWLLGTTPKPFATMSEPSVARLVESPFGPRFAWDHLHALGPAAHKWQEPNAVEVFPILSLLARIETRLRNLMIG